MAKRKLASGDDIVIRHWGDEDKPFIMSSWLRSFKSSRYAGPIPNNMYWTVYAQAIEQILDRDGVKVLIACNPEKESQIFGYIVLEQNHEAPVVHWLYIKQPFRGWGMARSLMGFCHILKHTEFSYTYRAACAAALTAQDGPWSGGRHKDGIARKKRRHLNETTGYLVQDTSEVPKGESTE